jgi:hypothetical protein
VEAAMEAMEAMEVPDNVASAPIMKRKIPCGQSSACTIL